jgi:hypothetical protein
MKTKMLIWIGLILQFTFLLFYLINAPEPSGAIKIGLERLQTACPTEAANIPETIKGAVPIETSGDDFLTAGKGFQYLVSVTIIFVIANILISILLIFSLRKKASQTLNVSQVG